MSAKGRDRRSYRGLIDQGKAHMVKAGLPESQTEEREAQWWRAMIADASSSIVG